MPILVPDSTPTPSPAVSLADLKRHLNMSSTVNDAELTDVLAAAEDMVEGIVGPLSPRSVVESHDAGYSALVLRQAPVVSVESVTCLGVVQAGWTLNGDAGLLTTAPRYGAVVVTYTAGRAVLPPAIRLAVLIVAGHMWETQRGASTLPLLGGGDTAQAPLSATYSLPNRALELLAGYRFDHSVA